MFRVLREGFQDRGIASQQFFGTVGGTTVYPPEILQSDFQDSTSHFFGPRDFLRPLGRFPSKMNPDTQWLTESPLGRFVGPSHLREGLSRFLAALGRRSDSRCRLGSGESFGIPNRAFCLRRLRRLRTGNEPGKDDRETREHDPYREVPASEFAKPHLPE